MSDNLPTRQDPLNRRHGKKIRSEGEVYKYKSGSQLKRADPKLKMRSSRSPFNRMAYTCKSVLVTLRRESGRQNVNEERLLMEAYLNRDRR